MAKAEVSAPPLGMPSIVNYGLGGAATGVGYAALSGTVLQYYLNQVIGLPPIVVGTTILLSLILDAVIDPLLGQWSDNFQSPLGRRHPFMYAAAVLASLSFYGLWHAPASLAGPALLSFMLALVVAVRISVSLFDVPQNALAPELAPDYDKRTVLASFRFCFFVFGSAGMLYALNAVFLHKYGMLSRTAYAQFGLVGAIIIFTIMMISALGTQNRVRYLHRPPRRRVTLAQTLREIVTTIGNPSLLALLASGVLGGAAAGMQTGLDFYFYPHLWGLVPSQLALLLPAASLASVVAALIAPALSRRLGKKRTMISLFSASTVFSLAPMTLKLLGLMPPTGSPWIFIILISVAVVASILGIMGFIIITSMVADVVEDTAVRTGVRSEGLLFATNGLVPKFTTGIGAFFAGVLLTAVRFPAHAVQGTVPAEIMHHLAVLYLPTYASLVVASIVVLAFYRIDRTTHQRNLERLKEMESLGMTSEPTDEARRPTASAAISGHAV
jgi:Na+/melibiose symporter-like transporter